MPQTATITRPTLKTPRAAAVAGSSFSRRVDRHGLESLSSARTTEAR